MNGSKRDRTTAKIDKNPDPDTSTPPPTKRAKPDLLAPYVPQFQRQQVATIGQAIAPPTLLRGDFHDAIAQLRDGGAQQVSTKFKLRVKFDTDASQKIEVRGDFGVFGQSTGLVQGDLKTPGYSAYVNNKSDEHSVLPVDLSPQRARIEARAIKQLSPVEADYSAKDKTLQFDGIVRTQKGHVPKQTVLGGIALGSHLEDITAKRAVGLEDVGSAIRAKTMTAKWKMKTEGTDDAGKGFRTDLLNAFPQLGSGTVPAANLPKGGISALKEHWESGGGTFSKQQQVQKIQEAHIGAYNAADGVFQHKFNAVLSGNGAQGKWWTQNSARFQSILADHNSGEETREQNAVNKFGEIREQYRARKLTRHGIKYP